MSQIQTNQTTQSKLYFLNSLITPFEGKEAQFIIKRISAEEAKEIIKNAKEIVSAIGHSSTAQILSVLLGIQVQTNRIQIYFAPGDEGIVITLKTRLPEGKVIQDATELERIGYELFYIKRTR